MKVRYTCRKCGCEVIITSFWTWFWTPHIGASKYMKCPLCGSIHAMPRKDGRTWLDWPKEKKNKTEG